MATEPAGIDPGMFAIPTTEPWGPDEGQTSDDLLRLALGAMDEYDPEDGKPVTDPEWRLLFAIERLHKSLSEGGALPRAWQNGHRR